MGSLTGLKGRLGTPTLVKIVIFDKGRPLVMAHRGDSAATPENTILSMRAAVELGVDVVETDVRLTKDGIPVLFHDDNMQRTAARPEAVGDLTLDELKQVDLGYTFTTDDGKTYPFRGKGLAIVTLEEAFREFPGQAFNLDIKDEDIKAPEILAETIKQSNRQESVLVGSFHDTQLVRFRNLMPEVPTSACPGEVTRFVFALKMRALGLFHRRCTYEAFQVPIKYGRISVIDDRFVKAAHDRNIAVHVWTINERSEMEWLVGLGVDGVFTDEPALFKTVLREKGLI